MSDVQVKLGKALLKSLVEMRQQKGSISLEDVGSMFMDMASSIQPGGSEADRFMHEEIARMAQHITEAKREIFSISSTDKEEDAIVDASQHLDEVIKATEEATNTIMNAADAIQNSVSGVGGDKEKEITDATMVIYEACTFQDLTGQRITKVIQLLQHIEERIGKLNSLFGTEGGKPVSAKRKKSPGELPSDAELLNGPQLAANAASQDDIDALFDSISSDKQNMS